MYFICAFLLSFYFFNLIYYRVVLKCDKSILIVLGSGGHTAEMLYLMENMNMNLYNKIILITSN